MFEFIKKIISSKNSLLRGKKLENGLLESWKRQGLLIEHVQDYAIFMLDSKGFVVTWNPGAERIMGYAEQEIVGQHFSCFYTQEDQGKAKPAQEIQFAALKGRVEEEGWRKRKDGTLFWASTVITAIYDQEKTLLGFAKVTRDLTERKKNEEELKRVHSELEKNVEKRTLELSKTNQELKKEIAERKRAEAALKLKTEELERSNKELEQFAYIASHDLQEPLYIIGGFADSIREQGAQNLDEESLFLLGRIQKASHRMSQLITDLLQYAKVNVQKDSFERVDLNLLIQEILVELDLKIKESRAMIQVNPLPQVYANKLQMRQLFQNLIMNAIKYRKKDVPLELIISVHPSERCFVEIRLQDNGIGFEPEYSSKILEPFQRLHSRGEYEGSGLGLAICQKIISRHGGKIEAKSVPEQGAIFSVTLPCKREECGGMTNKIL
ncbi:MAG: PAS domain S-box protein [Deltaproteobacteria bacterium]|nr:PAS domain S-box protein [Deltaproteobacteria bacterium]